MQSGRFRVDDMDRVQALVEFDLAAALAVQRERSADAATSRNGIAGRCIDCGDAIEPARLRLLPHAARCASCAHEHEHRQRMWR